MYKYANTNKVFIIFELRFYYIHILKIDKGYNNAWNNKICIILSLFVDITWTVILVNEKSFHGNISSVNI